MSDTARIYSSRYTKTLILVLLAVWCAWWGYRGGYRNGLIFASKWHQERWGDPPPCTDQNFIAAGATGSSSYRPKADCVRTTPRSWTWSG